MGIGTILVLFSGAVAAIITRDRSTSRYWIPLVFALSLYFVFALASPITLGETSLITYRLPDTDLENGRDVSFNREIHLAGLLWSLC